MVDGADEGIDTGRARGSGTSSVGVDDPSTQQLGSVLSTLREPGFDPRSSLPFVFSQHSVYGIKWGGYINEPDRMHHQKMSKSTECIWSYHERT